MTKNNLKSRPPKLEEKIAEFIEGAETKKLNKEKINPKTSVKKQSSPVVINLEEVNVMPWEENIVREDVKKVFSLRLSEPYMLKLQFIQKTTERSMQKFCLEHILPAIDNEVDRLVAENSH